MDGSSRQIGEPTGCKLSQFTICVGVWLELRFVINLQLVCWCKKCGSKVKGYLVPLMSQSSEILPYIAADMYEYQ